ncbi:MAG: ZIP family metal transporter, partial [Coprobacillaceae bacterium]
AISLPMHQSGKSKLSAMMYGQFSALVEIPSAILGFLFASMIGNMLPFTLSFAAGAMMFVCIEELIPEANSTENVDLGTISCMIGFLIMMTLDIMLS